eukprot:4200317-Prymnesium_polylepis.1
MAGGGPAPSEAVASPADDLAEQCTLILTTSPSPVMPSTELLHTVLRSFASFAPPLCACRLLIICDGTKPASNNNYRSGRIDDGARKAYVEYKANLRALVQHTSFVFARAE